MLMGLMAFYFASLVISVTPIGIVLNTEVIWTTILSPFLIFSYPTTAISIAAGGNTECMKVSQMFA